MKKNPTWFQGLGDIKSKAILFNLEVQEFMHFLHFIPLRLGAKYEWMLTQSTNVDINALVSCLKKKLWLFELYHILPVQKIIYYQGKTPVHSYKWKLIKQENRPLFFTICMLEEVRSHWQGYFFFHWSTPGQVKVL